MKSILIVTEQFTIGGLETHICGEIIQLIKNGLQVHLAVSKHFDNSLLPSGLSSISHDIPFNAEATPHEIITAVNRLRSIVQTYAIDIIHIHPFVSIIPAAIAAELEHIPYALTLHSPASIFASYGPVYDFFKEIIFNQAPLLISVSPEVQNLLKTHSISSHTYIPNTVPMKDEKIQYTKNNHYWLIISRLDKEKIEGILDFCIKAKKSRIPEVWIAGDGAFRENLIKLLDDNALSNYTKLIGKTTKTSFLIQESAGVAGMGRVALEAMALKKPVVLVGYDGVKGVLDEHLLINAAKCNFSGRELKTINTDELNNQLNSKITASNINALYCIVKEKFNDTLSWPLFLKQIATLKPSKKSILSDFYDAISYDPPKDKTHFVHNIGLLTKINTLICSKKFYISSHAIAVLIQQQTMLHQAHQQAASQTQKELLQQIAEYDEQTNQLLETVDEQNKIIMDLKKINHLILNSRSWKLTKPLRGLKNPRILWKYIMQYMKHILFHHRLLKLKSKIRFFLYNLYKKLPFKYQKILKKIVLKYRYKPSVHPSNKNEVNPEVVNWIENLLAHQDLSRLVICLQPTFFVPDGSTCYNGGAERYLLDLSQIFINHHYEFLVVQLAEHKSWLQRYEHLSVIGLPAITNHDLFLRYAALLVEKAAVFIASPFPYANNFNTSATYTIGISHGVYWDRPEYQNPQFYAQISQSVSQLNRLISVDTNTINAIQEIIPAQTNVDAVYIPNYVDPLFKNTKFHLPISTTPHNTVILFPRRLHEARGFYLLIDLIPTLFTQYDDLIFLFCGHGENHESKLLTKLSKTYPNQIYHFVLDPNDVYAAYKIADIVLIPTLYSEGTSLSCIEAMEAQKAIITTCVGGLTDLIINEYSGLLVNPNKDEIFKALCRLIENKSLRESLAKNAFKEAQQFHKKRWVAQWESIVKDIPNSSVNPLNAIVTQNYTLIHPSTFLIYTEMKQRPQHLFEACANLDIACLYIDATPHITPKIINKNLYLIDKDSKVNYANYCVYSYYPFHYLEFVKIKPKILIYDVLDAPEIHQSEEAIRCHDNMLMLADIIITSSKLLYMRYKKELKQQEIHYIPNAAAPNSLTKQARAADFPNHRQKTIGYYGAIAEWFDFELLDKICSVMSDCQIILLGSCRKHLEEHKKLSVLLEKHHNLFYLGPKPYEHLSQYAHYFDVSIIPFLENEVTKNCSPVKLFEYMNIGKPIITSEMPECRFYQSALVAKNHDEFIELIQKALHMNKNDNYFNIMKEEAEENTWQARADILKEALQRVYDVKFAAQTIL